MTHVLMDGGILCVPPEETNEFFREYIQTIKSGQKLYVVEQKTSRFKFFIDFDYKDPEKLSDADIMQFCSIIHSATGSFSDCLIARTKHRPVKEGIKTGVHIHWPDLVVDRAEALKMRSKIILALGDGPWETIIDPMVYGGSGLRMLWSHKKPSGDPYIPWRSIHGREFSKEPDAEILSLFSVRVNGAEPSVRSEPVTIVGIEEFIQKYMMGQHKTRVKKIHKHEHDGWYIQTDSTFCENIQREHKSNHVWFSIRSGRISQRCFDETCSKFSGQEHILPPSIGEQLKHVDDSILDDSSNLDVFPVWTSENVSEVRDDGPSVFGIGPGKLETFFDKP